jgi:hypothetical protein
MEPLLAVPFHGRDLLRRVHGIVAQDEDPALGARPDDLAVHINDDGQARFVREEPDRVPARLLLVRDVEDRVGVQLRSRTLLELGEGLTSRFALAVQPIEEHVRWES